MIQGQFVTIYEDPISQQRPEGRAKLLSLLKTDEDKEYWRVWFIEDGAKVNRWIRTQGGNTHAESI